jgi:hypothetical protein
VLVPGSGRVQVERAPAVVEVAIHAARPLARGPARAPTPAQSDPFNHGGERLTGPCLPGF